MRRVYCLIYAWYHSHANSFLPYIFSSYYVPSLYLFSPSQSSITRNISALALSLFVYALLLLIVPSPLLFYLFLHLIFILILFASHLTVLRLHVLPSFSSPLIKLLFTILRFSCKYLLSRTGAYFLWIAYICANFVLLLTIQYYMNRTQSEKEKFQCNPLLLCWQNGAEVFLFNIFKW